jgi:hypothetical protein
MRVGIPVIIAVVCVVVYLSGPMTLHVTDKPVLAMARGSGGVVLAVGVEALKAKMEKPTGDASKPPPPRPQPEENAGALEWAGAAPSGAGALGSVMTVAGDGKYVWAATANPPALARLVSPEAAPAVTIPCSYTPVALGGREGTLLWTETRPARLKGVQQIPIAGAIDVVRAASTDGQNARTLSLETGGETWGNADMLGVAGGRIYWTQRNDSEISRPQTLVYSVTPEGADRRVEEAFDGKQWAVLRGDKLCYTGLSQEFDSSVGAYSVWERPLAGGTPTYITDWLTPGGPLLARGNDVYWPVATAIWRVPRELGFPQMAWDARLTRLSVVMPARDSAYVAMLPAGNPGHSCIVKVPLGWRGRVSNILRRR